MNGIRMVALALIVAGVLGLAYGSFTYTKQTHEVKLGPIDVAVKEQQTVNIPVWAGLGSMVFGAAILFMGRKSP